MNTRDKLASAAALMDGALTESTGLKDLQRKSVTYWTLGTHSLRHVNTYSMLALLGKMGTGKSQTLAIIENFARCPVRLSLRSMTTPAIRDKLAEAHNGTAIVEEADSAWKDSESTVERLLSDRYHRRSASESHKVKSGDNWRAAEKEYFGATVLHRRIPFNDPALDGRTVRVRFRPDHARQYREYRPEDERNEEARQLLRGFEFEPPEMAQPEGVAGRIFNTYRSLLSTAMLCGDEDFIRQLHAKLLQETLELRDAQSSEPDGLVLASIVEAVFESGDPNFRNVKLSELAKSIWDNHRFPFNPRQIGPIARDLGFETKPSHGVTVVAPTPATLLAACAECEYSDEAIEELRRSVSLEGTTNTAAG
jgi:hypothetical protein